MAYFRNFHKSASLFRNNLKIVIPGLWALLMGLAFSFFFVMINDLVPILLRDPSALFIAGGLPAVAKKISSILITHSQLLKIGISLAGFVIANFLAGSTLIGMRFSMINDIIKGKKVGLRKSFSKGMTYYWPIVEMRIMVFLFVIILSILLSLPLFVLSQYTGDNALIVIASVIVILLLIKLLLLFRYPIMLRHNLRAIPALTKSMVFFKRYIKYTFVVWLITVFLIFAANVFFDLFRNIISEYIYSFIGWAVILLIFYVFKEFVMVFINTLIDVFGFVSYVKRKK